MPGDGSPASAQPASPRLIAVKAVHTLAWALFAGCIVAMPIVAWCCEHRVAAWLGAFVFVEVVVLACNQWRCPLTAVAARYTTDRRANFDIYLPLWVAGYNKQIFGPLYVAGLAFVAVHWWVTRR